METQDNKDHKINNPADPDKELKGQDNNHKHNIDEKARLQDKKSDEEQADQDDNGPENDALNYKNDRENGAYNPKNI